MAYSSYQVQRMMERLKRMRASTEAETPDTALAHQELDGRVDDAAEAAQSDAAPIHITRVVSGLDRVELSARAIQQAIQASAAQRLSAGPRIPTVTIIDDSPLPLPTRIELERRAGSFMRPPLAPSPGPLPIPRVRRPSPVNEAADPLADVLGEAD
jgi:hypothetical protein